MSAIPSQPRHEFMMEPAKTWRALAAKSRDAVEASDSAGAVARALAALSEAQLLRLGTIARLRARALPSGVSWSDLLHEALVRALDGSRQWPSGVPLLVFLAGVMRSICDEIWRHRRREVALIAFGEDAEGGIQDVACPAPDQERVLAASETLAELYRLFAGDGNALRILAGLGNRLSGADIRATHGLSEAEYDSTRRRMRRLVAVAESGSIAPPAVAFIERSYITPNQ